MHSQSSLFRRLMLGFGGVMLIVALIGMTYVLIEAKATQRARTAAENSAHAREILLHMVAVGDKPGQLASAATALEQVRAEMFRKLDYHSRVRLRVWKDGRLVVNSLPALPDALPAPGSEAARHANAWVWSVVSDERAGIKVERAHEVDDEWMLTFSGVSFLMSNTVFSLPLLLLPAWLIVGIGLRPLRSIADVIEQRSAYDLTALPDSKYKELSPLVQAINRLMKRLNQSFEREHEFLTDAAHELKTPLAAIQINAHLLLSRCSDDAAQRCAEAAEGLRDGVARATHMVHQLLALERAHTEPNEQDLPQADLGTLVRDRLAVAAPMAMMRNVEIEFQADEGCVRPVHIESMAALLDNLISNAVKYSPEGGRITVKLAQLDGGHRLSVSDQGPGIDPALHQKVFERFYRIPGQGQSGSGLGLAIAERAAARNQATIALGVGENGIGLTVTVNLPRAP